MNKTDEELNQAEKMAKRHGVRMCDENGDTHGEELYCIGIDDIADIIREARAEQDHIADAGKMVAETVKTYEQGYLDGYDAGLIFANSRVEPVKQEPVVTERQFKLAMKQWEDWKAYALELQEKLVKHEGGSPMILNTAPVQPVKQQQRLGERYEKRD